MWHTNPLQIQGKVIYDLKYLQNIVFHRKIFMASKSD